METVKEHFEEEAKEFDKIIVKLIPHYHEMVDCLIASIPFNISDKINVIDLGCGTGNIGKAIIDRYPDTYLTCIDLSQNMIEIAKIKLSKYPNVKFLVQDFCQYEFESKYDIIISSLSLHHIRTSEDKINFYKKIYKSLSGGGVFYNADVVLGSNKHLQNIYMQKWKAFMNKRVSIEEIDNKWIPKYYEEDYPSILLEHIKWLQQIGFLSVDVLWKYYNFAVYGGYKPNQ